MSLATRCTACGTAFRVVQDQLKVSEGWVRCGRCNEVFNAVAGLFDLERESPERWQKTAEARPSDPGQKADPAATNDPRESDVAAEEAQSAIPADDPAISADATAPGAAIEVAHAYTSDQQPYHDAPFRDDKTEQEPEDEHPQVRKDQRDVAAHDGPGVVDEQKTDGHPFWVRRGQWRRAPPADVDQRDRLDFSDARFDSDHLGDNADVDETVDASHGTLSPVPTLSNSVASPEFVRRADVRARWQQPKVRAGLAFAALALASALLLQAGHHFRDSSAARWPALKPALARWCALASCTIEAPRRIDEVSVESTALSRAPGGDSFRLAVTLRSRSALPVAVPWIDLSLTDPGGKLVARKAIASRDLNPAAIVLQPGAEVVLQASLNARDPRVAGYTVEIFYP